MAGVKRIAQAAETYEDNNNENEPWWTAGVAFAWKIKVVLAMLFCNWHAIDLVLGEPQCTVA